MTTNLPVVVKRPTSKRTKTFDLKARIKVAYPKVGDSFGGYGMYGRIGFWVERINRVSKTHFWAGNSKFRNGEWFARELGSEMREANWKITEVK
ncbi:MAG: hypothetical protein WC766_06225 [Patescibacteria group bacterium]